MPRLTAARVLPPLVAAFVATALAQGCAVEPTFVAGDDGGGSSGAGSSNGGSGGGSGSGSGGSFGDAGSCEPGSVATFQPTVYHPAAAAWQGACVSKLYDPIQLFYDQCLGATATTATCAKFSQDFPSCTSCILTPESADHYGPLIDHGGFVTANQAGCIELTDPGALACAKSVQAVSECELSSCEANCPVSDSASLNGYEMCVHQADSAGCGTLESAAACTGPLADAGPGAAGCLLTDFAQFYNHVVPLFCGQMVLTPPPTGDAASADGESDATSASDTSAWPADGDSD